MNIAVYVIWLCTLVCMSHSCELCYVCHMAMYIAVYVMSFSYEQCCMADKCLIINCRHLTDHLYSLQFVSYIMYTNFLLSIIMQC